MNIVVWLIGGLYSVLMFMVIEKNLQALFLEASHARNTASLWQVMTDFCDEHGFIYCRLSVFPLHGKIDRNSFLLVKSHDKTHGGWAEHYINNRMYEYDQSVHLVRGGGMVAMKWTEMRKKLRPGTLAHDMFLKMKPFGMEEGMLVPHSSLISNHTAFLGIGGPREMFKPFRRKNLTSLIWAIRVVIDRLVMLAVKEKLLSKPVGPEIKLTDGQRELLLAICNGALAQEIAESQDVLEKSVNTATSRLKDKIGGRTLASAVALAFRNGIIT